MNNIRQVLRALEDRNAAIVSNADTGTALVDTQQTALREVLTEQIKEAALQLRTFAPQHPEQTLTTYSTGYLFLVTRDFGSKKHPVTVYVSLEGEEADVYEQSPGHASRQVSLDYQNVGDLFDILIAIQHRLQEG